MVFWLGWNMTFMFPYIGNNHPSWLIFFRGVITTNQFLISSSCLMSPLCNDNPNGLHQHCSGSIVTIHDLHEQTQFSSDWDSLSSNPYPPVIKHGNGKLMNMDRLSMIFLLKPPFSSGIFQPAMFDYQMVLPGRILFQQCSELGRQPACAAELGKLVCFPSSIWCFGKPHQNIQGFLK